MTAFILNCLLKDSISYRTRAIITRGLYTFYPIFEGQKRVFKELFSQNSDLMYGLTYGAAGLVFKSGFKSIAGYSGARTVHKKVPLQRKEVCM